MRGLSLRALLATPLVLCACASHAAGGEQPAATATVQDVVEQVRRAERAWLDAYETHDAAAMARLLAAEFVITYPGGRQSRRDDVLRQVAASAGGPGTRFSTENVVAHRAGSTIVLTGTVIGHGARGQSRQIYTDTWVRDGEGWKVLSSHLSSAPPEEPRQAE